MGPGGRGTGEHFGLHDEVDLITGTFSKSFGSIGGVVAGEREVIDWIKHHARSMIFQASMSPAAVAAALAALEIIEAEPERRERLWQIAGKMRAALQEMGYNTGVSVHADHPDPGRRADQVPSTSGSSLLEAGVFTNAVIPPAVEPGRSMLRTSYQAAHTEEQLDQVLDVFETIGLRLKIIQRKKPSTLKPITIALQKPPALEDVSVPLAAAPAPAHANGNGHAQNGKNGRDSLFVRLQPLRERLVDAWSLTGLPTLSSLERIDLDKLQRQGQATFDKVKDTMEAVTYRAVNLDPSQLTQMPKKILSRVRRNGRAQHYGGPRGHDSQADVPSGFPAALPDRRGHRPGADRRRARRVREVPVANLQGRPALGAAALHGAPRLHRFRTPPLLPPRHG